MAEPTVCLGHEERGTRRKKMDNLLRFPVQHPDENLRVLIRKGPVSEETSLKELEDSYGRKPEWKVIEEGGVLSIPVEEFRMIDLQKPENFGKAKGKKGTKIENYTVGQTIENLNSLILTKYNEEKENSKAAGKSQLNLKDWQQLPLINFLCSVQLKPGRTWKLRSN